MASGPPFGPTLTEDLGRLISHLLRYTVGVKQWAQMADRENHGATIPKERASARDVRRRSTDNVNRHGGFYCRDHFFRVYDGWELGGSAAMAGA